MCERGSGGVPRGVPRSGRFFANECLNFDVLDEKNSKTAKYTIIKKLWSAERGGQAQAPHKYATGHYLKSIYKSSHQYSVSQRNFLVDYRSRPFSWPDVVVIVVICVIGWWCLQQLLCYAAVHWSCRPARQDVVHVAAVCSLRWKPRGFRLAVLHRSLFCLAVQTVTGLWWFNE